MKTNKSTPSAKGRTTSKVTPATQGSPAAKPAPTLKANPAKALPLETAEPQDQATQPVVHSASEVALRAYHNYQKRGSTDGEHTDDWLRAESELTAERLLVRA
jgi:hypothetical protein